MRTTKTRQQILERRISDTRRLIAENLRGEWNNLIGKALDSGLCLHAARSLVAKKNPNLRKKLVEASNAF